MDSWSYYKEDSEEFHVSSTIRGIMASGLAYAVAIMTTLVVLLLFVFGAMVNDFRVGIVLSVPFLFGLIEAWVTVGSAQGGNSIKSGGLIVGKVYSVLSIVATGIVIIVSFIMTVGATSLLRNFRMFFDNTFELILYQVFGDASLFNRIMNATGGIVFIAFFLSMIPYVLNIVMQVQLNIMRNNIILAGKNRLSRAPRLIFLAVLLIMTGIPVLVFSMIFLISGARYSRYFIPFGLAYIIVSVMYFLKAALVIKICSAR